MSKDQDNDSRNVLPGVRIGSVEKDHGVLALGCWAFGGAQWGGQEEEDSLATMETALRCGINHFDTAVSYGPGHSETVVGKFLACNGRRDKVFLASKTSAGPNILDELDESLARLQVDCIDLYYIHWPRTGVDTRQSMEDLEKARQQGKISAIGVSNFSVEQMEQVSQVGKIDAHQMCYNLFWRFPEERIIPYCNEHDIAVVTYSSIAQGILSGKFPLDVKFPEGDSRSSMVMFEPDVWPHVHEGVEQLKTLADQAGRPLSHLAIRWVAEQKSVRSVLVGARNIEQIEQNALATKGDIPQDIFERMTEISDEAMKHIPDTGNIFRHYP